MESDAFADGLDDSRALVAHDEVAAPIERIVVRMTNPQSADRDAHLVRPGWVDGDVLNAEGALSVGDGGFGG